MNDQNKPSDKQANDSLWESVEKIAKNIIEVVKDILALVKPREKKSP